MALLGLLILLSVGMLSAMELSAPPRRAAAIVQPPAESIGISVTHDALEKADRLEVAAVSSAVPMAPTSVGTPVAPQDVHVGSSAPAPIVRQRNKPKPVATAERPKSKPKPKPKPKPTAAVVKRTANVQRAKAASESESCRLKAFGGLLKALNLARCEI
jgi:outer membrane biosynthesis protein TonB